MNPSRVVAFCVSTVAWFGCSTISPSNFGAKAPDLGLVMSGPIAVSTIPHAEPESRFNANGVTFEVDLDEFSDHLADLLRESLEEAGATISPGGKHIALQVVYLDFMFKGPCYVDYSVAVGGGAVFGLQATGESSNFSTACRKALEQAVPQVVSDPRTLRYFGSP